MVQYPNKGKNKSLDKEDLLTCEQWMQKMIDLYEIHDEKFQVLNSLEVIWKSLVAEKNTSWVLFKHGTCVVVENPKIDLQLPLDKINYLKSFLIKQKAVEILMKNGLIYPGTPSADMYPRKLKSFKGWIVYYDHPDIMNYVTPDELSLQGEINKITFIATVGLTGRKKRNLDAMNLEITHIEKSS